MAAYFLGIDNGGTMTKAALFDAAGNEVAAASGNTPVLVEQDCYNQRDMDIMWQTTAAAIRGALEISGILPEEIVCIGCTGHGKGLYPWGRSGRPAYYGIASTDRRAESYIRKWQRDGTAEKAQAISLQPVIACQPAALLAWLKEHAPGAYEEIEWIFEAKDYIRFRLTGEAYGEVTDYSGTSLMDLRAGTYSKELLTLFGIAEMYDKLPPLRCSGDSCGAVTEEAARVTGLKAGTPVCGGMFDIDACAIAMDVLSPEKMCIITGTWSINEYVSAAPVPSGGTTKNSLFCIPGYYLIEESSPTSAGNLDWYLDLMTTFQNKAAVSQKQVYQKADSLVEMLNPADSEVVFLPFLYGTNAAGADRSAFLGLHSGHRAEHMLRAIYEGVVFSHKMHIDRLLRYRRKPAAMRLAGGAANSDIWMQMFADVLGVSVEVVDAKELGALGCAMAAAVCSGIYRDYLDAAQNMVRIRKVFQPDIAKREIYDRKYRAYTACIDALAKQERKE